MLCFPWKRFGECDTTSAMSFYVVWMYVSDVFLVTDVYSIQCSGIEWSDERQKPLWGEYSRLCDEAVTEFKKCYRDNICDLREHVYEHAKRVFLGATAEWTKTAKENSITGATSDGKSNAVAAVQ